MLSPRTALAGGALAAAIVLAACSGASTDATGAAVGATGTGGAADVTTGTGGTADVTIGAGGSGGFGGSGGAHPPYDPATDAPQVVDLGGTVLASPRVQLIAYASDPTLPDVEAFLVELGATPTWSAQTAEYGVGAFTALPTIAIAGTPPVSLDDDTGNVTPLQKKIAQQLSGPNPAWGAADASTIYLLLMPVGTDVLSGGSCCVDFLGYHGQVAVGAIEVPYAVVCDCAPLAGDKLTPLEYVTTTVIHELAEAATDPFSDSDPAYAQTDDDHILWTDLTGGEVSDMCDENKDANFVPAGATYMIQRSWSNAAARAGKNPCVPVSTAAPYFNSIPVQTSVTLPNYGQPVQTKGVKIAVGQSATIDVQLYSEAPTSGPWTIKARDFNEYYGLGNPRLQLSLDKTSGQSGDIVKLTITVLKANKNLGGEAFVLQSELDGQQNLSVGVVVNN